MAGPDPNWWTCAHGSSVTSWTDYVVLQVKGPEGVDLAAPVSHGIPLAKGSLNPDELDRLYLVDADGHSVPMQARSLAQWPDGSVKWVLVSFIGQPGEYVLHVGKEAQPQSQHRLIETLGDASLQSGYGAPAIDAGCGRFTQNRRGLYRRKGRGSQWRRLLFDLRRWPPTVVG